MLESNAVIILHFLIFAFPMWASLYHNFQSFHWKCNWILQPYDTEKEFLLIFFYVCWFEISAPRRSLHFRVTFFLYLIYKGWLKAEQHLNGEFFLRCISQKQGMNKWQQGKSLFFINKWLAWGAVKCDGIKYNKSVEMHPEFPSSFLLCP